MHGQPPGIPPLIPGPTLQDLEFWKGFHGPFYRFEHVELARNHTDEAHVGQHYALWMERKGLANWRDYFRPPTGSNDRQRRTWQIPEAFHYGTWIAERCCDLLAGYAERRERFFFWSSFFDPHPKYLVPEPWDAMYDPASLTVPAIQAGEHDANPPHFRLTQTANPDFSAWRETGQGVHGFSSHLHDRDELAKDIACYYGMISLMDRQIGTILDRLEALGLASDTLVVFTSDHGHLFGQHDPRDPLIVAQPGSVPGGRRSDALQSLVDFAPSFLPATGIPVPGSMTGVDQTDVWYGRRESLRDHVVVENRHEPTTVHLKTYVEERYKLTVYFQRDYGELFDLATDPGEVDNLWDVPEARGLKNDLIRKLLFAEMGKEPLPMPRIAGA